MQSSKMGMHANLNSLDRAGMKHIGKTDLCTTGCVHWEARFGRCWGGKSILSLSQRAISGILEFMPGGSGSGEGYPDRPAALNEAMPHYITIETALWLQE